MAAEITILPYDEKYPQVACAMYLATLAYPENLKRRTRFVNACRAWWLKGQGNFPKEVYKKEIIAFSERRNINREINRVNKILVNKRRVADYVLSFYLMNLAIPVLLKKRKYSISRALLTFGKNSSADEADVLKNKYKRVWKDSAPVIHLMTAMRNCICDFGIKGNYDIYDLLQNPHWVKKATFEAERMRKLLCSNKLKLPSVINETNSIQIIIQNKNT